MRRIALLGLPCLLAACQFAGNPFAGAGGFLYDTHTFHSNPNLPAGSDETMQRVEDKDVSIQPLLPEPGDIWPGPMQPIPTVQDLEQQNMEPLPSPNVPATPPPMLFPGESPNPGPGGPQVYTTPHGTAVVPMSGTQAHTATAPGGQGVAMPNANGTSTPTGPGSPVGVAPSAQ